MLDVTFPPSHTNSACHSFWARCTITDKKNCVKFIHLRWVLEKQLQTEPDSLRGGSNWCCVALTKAAFLSRLKQMVWSQNCSSAPPLAPHLYLISRRKDLASLLRSLFSHVTLCRWNALSEPRKAAEESRWSQVTKTLTRCWAGNEREMWRYHDATSASVRVCYCLPCIVHPNSGIWFLSIWVAQETVPDSRFVLVDGNPSQKGESSEEPV